MCDSEFRTPKVLRGQKAAPFYFLKQLNFKYQLNNLFFMEKAMQYTAQLASAILDAINNEDSEFYIGGSEELKEGNNMTSFSHALINMAPLFVFQYLTDYKGDLLDFNCTANRLNYQFSKQKPTDDSEESVTIKY